MTADPLLVFPTLPPEQVATAEFAMRYDDVDQEARLKCGSAANSLGPAVWATLLNKHPVAHWGWKTLVLPVLSRLLVERGDGPLSVRKPLVTKGALDFAHVVGKEPGSVDRIIAAMWVELEGAVGLTNGPKPPNAGEPILAARIYGEHVLTAVFAAAGQRKVQALGAEGFPSVPPRVYEAPPLELYASPPAGATLIGEPMLSEPHLFGLVHTDANRHVNSLVYPTLFEAHALACLAAHRETKPRLARFLELGFRRPFFAGERARIRTQLFRDAQGALGAAATMEPMEGKDGAPPKPSTYARLRF